MIRLVALLVALVLVPAAGAVRSGGTELALVAAEDDDRLVAVEPERGRVVARLRVPDGPHNVAVARDRRFVLVTSPPAGSVTLVDAFGPRVLHVFRGLRSPHDVEIAPDRRHAYVTEEAGASVAVLDLRARRVVRRVRVPAGPHDLAVRPDGRRVWVTHGPRARTITILDTEAPRRARVLARTGAAGAHDIAFARDGRWIWLTYWDSSVVGKVRAYDRLGTLRLQRRLGALVHHVEVDLRGRVWATDHERGEAMLLSSRSARPLRRLFSCPGAHHVAVGPGRGRVAVACHDSGTIVVFDPVARRSRTFRVGRGPHGVAVAFVP